MTAPDHGLYVGEVVHTRLTPRFHKLRYRVFSCLFDCARLDELSGRLGVFSRNRFNLVSLHDADHTEGGALEPYLRRIANESGRGADIERFMMLCYPRILGYAFNPLTAFFGLDAKGATRLTIYQVRNTFGECSTYVLPAQPDAHGHISQSCRKRFYVSPFNAVEGRYSFHATPLADDLTLGVALKTEKGPILKAHFRGHRQELTDANLLKALARTGWMTVKVTAGIHFEALKLLAKGLRVVPRPKDAAPAFTYVATPRESEQPNV